MENDFAPRVFNNHFGLQNHKYYTCNILQNFSKKDALSRHRKLSIEQRGPTLWNSILNLKMKTITSISSFKHDKNIPYFLY